MVQWLPLVESALQTTHDDGALSDLCETCNGKQRLHYHLDRQLTETRHDSGFHIAAVTTANHQNSWINNQIRFSFDQGLILPEHALERKQKESRKAHTHGLPHTDTVTASEESVMHPDPAAP